MHYIKNDKKVNQIHKILTKIDGFSDASKKLYSIS